MLRTAMQHHIQLSAMADQKSNIIIGTNSIIFSFAISQIKLDDPTWGLFSLCATSIGALIFGILAVMPSYMGTKRDLKKALNNNMLFFGHFTQLKFEDYLDELDKIVISDRKVFESIVNDLYQMGMVLKNRKYKYLSLSYRIFLNGIIVALVLILSQLFFR